MKEKRLVTELRAGTILQKRYEVKGAIHKGGQGVVYEALDLRVRARVALKQSLRTDTLTREQFMREAQLLAEALDHPALPSVTDHFIDDEGQFLVMKYIPGDDLDQQLNKRDVAFEVAKVLAWADQLLDALQHLHTRESPIIHCDIKPANLKAKADGRVILLDFGIAQGPVIPGETIILNIGYTRGYAPPEQVMGEGVDARSDLYALGSTLYHLLTRQPPIDGTSRKRIIDRGDPDPMQPPHKFNDAVPEAVSAVLMWALEIGPEKRPQSAQEMRAALNVARNPVHSHYLIVRPIGSGRFGVVYEAINENLGARVALKQSLRTDTLTREQFMREAQLLAEALDHPALPSVTDHFIDDEGQFLVMKYIPGDDLETMLVERGSPFPLNQVLAWADRLLDALHCLHTHNPPIIHCDIKPRNLKLVSRTNEIMLLGFGTPKGSADPRVRIFTRGYAPPEQVMGEGVDARSDLYALGSTLYRLLTRQPPIDGTSRKRIIDRGDPDPMQPPHKFNDAVPEAVSAVLMWALEIGPEKRPQSALQMRAALEAAVRPAATKASHQVETVATPPVAPPVPPESVTEEAETVVEAPKTEKTQIDTTDWSDETQAKPHTQASGHQSTQVAQDRQEVAVSVGIKKSPDREFVDTEGLVVGAEKAGRGGAALDSLESTLVEEPATSRRVVPHVSGTAFTRLRTLCGHAGPVRHVAFSPDGQTLASTSDDTTMKLWRVNDGAELRTFSWRTGWLRTMFGPPDVVFHVAFSPDGQTLASASWNGQVKLWRVSDGAELRTFSGRHGGVHCVAFSPDGQTLASASWDRPVRLWRVSDGTELGTLSVHALHTRSVAFSPDGQTLASTSVDGTVQLWRVIDGAELRTLPGNLWLMSEGANLRPLDNALYVYNVAFSPDWQMLASTSWNGPVRLWRVSDGAQLRTLAGHTGWVYNVAFSPDGQTLTSASADGTVKLWRVSDGTELRTLAGHTGQVSDVAFSPDGQTLASKLADWGTVKLWRVSDGAELGTLSTLPYRISHVAFSPDGGTLAVASFDGTVTLCRVR